MFARATRHLNNVGRFQIRLAIGKCQKRESFLVPLALSVGLMGHAFFGSCDASSGPPSVLLAFSSPERPRPTLNDKMLDAILDDSKL